MRNSSLFTTLPQWGVGVLLCVCSISGSIKKTSLLSTRHPQGSKSNLSTVATAQGLRRVIQDSPPSCQLQSWLCSSCMPDFKSLGSSTRVRLHFWVNWSGHSGSRFFCFIIVAGFWRLKVVWSLRHHVYIVVSPYPQFCFCNFSFEVRKILNRKFQNKNSCFKLSTILSNVMRSHAVMLHPARMWIRCLSIVSTQFTLLTY
jgi:hypothetical protein